MSQSAQPATLLNTFTTFLTVTIHTILYHRSLYDPSLFLPAKKYNIPVRQCRHPELCIWIDDCVSHISDLMKSGSDNGEVECISIVVFSPGPEERPLERFVVDVTALMGLDEGVLERELREEERREVEMQFRAAVGKIVVGCEKLGDLPEDCTFTVAVDARESQDQQVPKNARRLEKDGKALVAPGPSQGRVTRSSQKKNGIGLQDISFGEGLGSVTIWIEESKRKRAYCANDTEEEETDPDVTA